MPHHLLIDAPDAAPYRLLCEPLEPGWKVEAIARHQPGFAAALSRATAMVTQTWGADTPPATRLQLLQLPGAGYDAIDFSALPSQCTVCNVYEHEIGIAEYVVLAILEWEIRLSRMDARLREGRWRDGFVLGAPLHGELFGKRVGIIGYGHIAQEVIRRLKPFGVEIWVRTRTPPSQGGIDNVGDMDTLGEMLEACDYVLVACPLTEQTRGLIGAEELGQMLPSAVIINVARGQIIAEEALFTACRDRRIGGAVIDTWYRYPDPSGGTEQICPPSSYPFETLDNVTMSPHASGWSAGLLRRRFAVMADNLNRLERSEPLRNVLRAPGAPPPA